MSERLIGAAGWNPAHALSPPAAPIALHVLNLVIERPLARAVGGWRGGGEATSRCVKARSRRGTGSQRQWRLRWRACGRSCEGKQLGGAFEDDVHAGPRLAAELGEERRAEWWPADEGEALRGKSAADLEDEPWDERGAMIRSEHKQSRTECRKGEGH